MIAEVSAPSLGVGYEIACAVLWGLPVVCLHKADVRVSAMISGNDQVMLRPYNTPQEAADVVRTLLLFTLPGHK